MSRSSSTKYLGYTVFSTNPEDWNAGIRYHDDVNDYFLDVDYYDYFGYYHDVDYFLHVPKTTALLRSSPSFRHRTRRSPLFDVSPAIPSFHTRAPKPQP